MLNPISPQHWSRKTAAHLALRAGFGGSPESVQTLAKMSPQAAVDHFLETTAPAPEKPPRTDWTVTRELRKKIRQAASPEEKQAARMTFQQTFRREMRELIRWWTRCLISSPAPEKRETRNQKPRFVLPASSRL
jgi:Protein of unknown function (DUF1800)